MIQDTIALAISSRHKINLGNPGRLCRALLFKSQLDIATDENLEIPTRKYGLINAEEHAYFLPMEEWIEACRLLYPAQHAIEAAIAKANP